MYSYGRWWRTLTYRLFVSHSSPTPEAQERLAAFAAALEAEAGDGSLRVLYDKEQINSGDDWRRRIAFMLHACNGGVVLMDDAALRSPWVLAEAMFLSLRHDAEDGFACFPVCFSDRDQLEQTMSVLEVLHDPDSGRMASWGVVNLTAVQFAQGDSVEAVAGRVVQSLRDRDDLNRQDSSADRLAGQLAEHLVGGSPQIIDELAEKLRRNAPYLVSNNRTALAALAIVQEVLDTGELFAARTMLGELGTAFSQSKRQFIISQLLPLQLRADSAALFLRRRVGGGLTHTGLFCDYPDFTVRTYLRRAYLTRVPPTLITLNSIHGSYEELQRALRAAWRQRLKKSALGHLTPEQVDRQLANLQRDVYVSLPGPVDEGVLAQLDAAYPRIAFVVHQASDGADLPLPRQLLPILPNLAGDEIRIIEDFEAADEDWEGQGSWQR